MQLRSCGAGIIDYIMSNIQLRFAKVILVHIVLSKIDIKFPKKNV